MCVWWDIGMTPYRSTALPKRTVWCTTSKKRGFHYNPSVNDLTPEEIKSRMKVPYKGGPYDGFHLETYVVSSHSHLHCTTLGTITTLALFGNHNPCTLTCHSWHSWHNTLAHWLALCHHLCSPHHLHSPHPLHSICTLDAL